MYHFKVSGMSCGHCVRAITSAVQAGDEQARVEVDLASQIVQVESQQALEQVVAAIRAEGYGVEAA